MKDSLMNVTMLKSKIHRARLTECVLDYEGSLEIDIDILKACGIRPYEKILVVNATNGERLETYAIQGKAGSKCFKLNGAAAKKGNPGDIVTIMVFGSCTEAEADSIKPKKLILDSSNDITARENC